MSKKNRDMSKNSFSSTSSDHEQLGISNILLSSETWAQILELKKNIQWVWPTVLLEWRRPAFEAFYRSWCIFLCEMILLSSISQRRSKHVLSYRAKWNVQGLKLSVARASGMEMTCFDRFRFVFHGYSCFGPL